ncbi:MAG: hypothetical protein WAV88_10460 [Candidatus Nanopelagicales bacterium]
MKITRSAGLGAGIVVATVVVSGALVAPAEAAKLPPLGSFGIHAPGWTEPSAGLWSRATKGKSCMIGKRCKVRGWILQTDGEGLWMESVGRTKSSRTATKLARSLRATERKSLALAVDRGPSFVQWRKVRTRGAQVWAGTGSISKNPEIHIRYVIAVKGNRFAYAAGYVKGPGMPQGKRLSKPLVKLVKGKSRVPKIKGKAGGLIPVVQSVQN